MERQKAVVTGGAGFIGSNLCALLLENGFEVVVVDTFVEGKRERLLQGVTLVEKDVRDTKAMQEAFAGAKVVFHTAALPRVQQSIDQPQEVHDTNVNGTLSVLVAAKEAGVKKVIFSASAAAYGDQQTLPLSETLPAHPKSPYALHKVAGEMYCKLFSEIYGLSTVSLRYFNVYGSNMDPDGAYALAVGKFLKMRKEGTPLTITGDGTQTRDFVHVRDVARANILAAQSTAVGSGEVINIGSGVKTSVNELAALIGGPAEHIAPRLEPHDSQADISLAKKILNWEPTISFAQGMAELKKEHGLPA